MSFQFRYRDAVEVIDEASFYFGSRGRIKSYMAGGDPYLYEVELADGLILTCTTASLKPISENLLPGVRYEI